MNYRISLTEMDSHAGRLNEVGDFVTVLKQGANADIARAMKDFNFADMMKDAGAGAKKVIVDGVTGLPEDIGPKLGEEFAKEGAKIVDNGGWKSWRELKEEEEKG